MSRHRFFQIPAEDVAPDTRRRAERWAAQAAEELGLAALGVPRIRLRWFLAPHRITRFSPGRGLAVLDGPERMAGQTRPQDPLGTIWLRADLRPDLAYQELAHYCGHEAKHVQLHARGRPWPTTDGGDGEAEVQAEAFAQYFCEGLRALAGQRAGLDTRAVRTVRSREEQAMPEPRQIPIIVNGLLTYVPLVEAGVQDAPATGPGGGGFPHPASVSGLVQGAALARTPRELSGVVDAWERAYDRGELTGPEADTALSFLEAANQRLERGTKATPGQPLGAQNAPSVPRTIEDSQPIKITTIR